MTGEPSRDNAAVRDGEGGTAARVESGSARPGVTRLPPAQALQVLADMGVAQYVPRRVLPVAAIGAPEAPAATALAGGETPSEPLPVETAAPMASRHCGDGAAPQAPRDPGGVITLSEASWETLEARVAGCTACPLHEGRTRTVFGVGPRDANWLVVGEGPGREEDLAGEPFVGRAGKLLDAMLGALDLDRRVNVYIANVVKCRPPNNRDPEPSEAEACRAYLERQIELLRPGLILAVGRIAAHRLLGTELEMRALRGRAHQYHSRQGTIPLLVTYHPAYLLRSPQAKAKVWGDLKYAWRVFREHAAEGDAAAPKR